MKSDFRYFLGRIQLAAVTTATVLLLLHTPTTTVVAARRSSSSWTKPVAAASSSLSRMLDNPHKAPVLMDAEAPAAVLGDVWLLRTRGGGAVLDDDDSDDEEDSDDDDDAYLLGDDLDDLDNDAIAESDFTEDNTLERMMDAFAKTPPLTKAYLTASAAATLYGYLFNKNQFPKILSLEWKPTLQRLQLWRPLTAFFNFGPFGISYLMTAHFVWTYMATLERLNHKAPYDFWIMILFGQLSMVLGYPLLNLSPRFLGHNLSTFLVYIWARYHEGLEVNLFELFNTRAELLPWFFLAQTFLLEGEPPVLDFLGICFGHLYHYCKTVGLLRAPPSWVTWYHRSDHPLATRMREQYQRISSDFEMI